MKLNNYIEMYMIRKEQLKILKYCKTHSKFKRLFHLGIPNCLLRLLLYKSFLLNSYQ